MRWSILLGLPVRPCFTLLSKPALAAPLYLPSPPLSSPTPFSSYSSPLQMSPFSSSSSSHHLSVCRDMTRHGCCSPKHTQAHIDMHQKIPQPIKNFDTTKNYKQHT